MQDERRWEEKAVDKAAEMGLSSQLDEAQTIDVDVHTNLLKMIFGQVDGVSFTGSGLLFKKDIRIQNIEVESSEIAVDVLSTLSGNVKLEKPADIRLKLVLTEADINQALASDFICNMMQKIALKIEGEMVSLMLDKIQLSFRGDGKLGFEGTVDIYEVANTQQLSFTGLVAPRTPTRKSIMLESFNCTQGEGVPLKVIAPLMKKVKEWVDLPYLQWEGIAFRIAKMEINTEIIYLTVEAKIQQLPSFVNI